MLTDNILLDDARVLLLSGDLASASSSSTTTPPASPGLVPEPPFAAPFWAKMSQTGPGSALPTLNNNNNTTKKRKKSDAKPLSQLNKCLNEKRRREQENVYIEELAELISASIADMNSLSVKPDKCAILQETVNQIRRIKEEDGRSADDVQQGEVSSSKPALLEGQVLSAFLLEALDGFLFVVNTEGKVEYVSANVSQFLHYSPEDLVGKSIYNIIHLGDHARFSSSLLPTSIGWPASEQANQTTSRSRVFNCRFLVQPPDEQDETIEEKQQRVSQYENLQISAVLNPYPGEKSDNPESPESGEAQNCLICVARRIPVSEKTPTLTGGPTVEQFTTRLDLSGRITAVDTSGVSATYSQYLNKDLVGCIIQELCHPSDLPKLCAHLKEALQTGQSTSPLYRLRVTPLSEAEREGRATPVEPAHCTYVRVQTKTKRFPFNPVTHEMEFLMAAHSIIGDQEVISDHESPGSSSSNPHSFRPGSTLASPTPVTSLAHHPVAPPTSSATSTPVPPPPPASGGNPLLTSVVRNLPSAAELTPSSLPSLETTAGTGFAPFTLNSTDLSLNDFSLDLFPSSTWDLIPNDNSLDDPTATSPSSHGMTLSTNPTQPNLTAAVSAVTVTANAVTPVLNHNHHGGSTSNLQHVAWASPPPRPASTSNNSYVVSRPSSRQSMSAASTPRPPSGYSPAPILAPISPAAPQPPSNNPPAQPSPSPFSNNFPFSPLQDHTATPTTVLGTGSVGTGNLGPGEDSKEGILNMTSPSSVAAADSGRLRNLLTQRPAASSNSMVHSALLQSLGLAEEGESLVAVKKEKEEKGHDHKILKGLLNQDDDDERARRNSGDVKPGGNNMLLKLLNVRNDDDDLEQQNGFRKQNELLQQLLKDQDVDRRTSSQHNSDTEQDSLLLKSLGFPATPNSNSQPSNHHGPRPNTPLTLGGLGPAATRSPASAHTADALGLSMAELQAGSLFRGAKRPSDEGMDTFRPSKQPMLDPSPTNSSGNTVLNQLLGASTNNGIMPAATTAQAVSVAVAPTVNVQTPTSGGGASTLCQRNRMLASLLARQPSAVPSPTTLASPKPSSLPQEKLPKDLKEKIMQAPLGPQPAALWGGSLVQSSAPNVTNNTLATSTANSDGLNRHPALLQATLNRAGPSVPGGNGFLNSLLNRPPQEAANDVNVNLNTINQRPLPPSHQQQQQQQRLQQATSTAQKVVISGGQQLSVSANINPSGGLNISLTQSALSVGLETGAGMPNNRRMPGGNNVNAPKSFQDVFTTEMGLAVADSLSAAGLGWDMQSTDPLLSDILDQVIEMDRNYDPPIADDTLMTILEGLRSPPPPSPVTPVPPVPPAPTFPVDMNEKLAINAITKSLMSFESVAPAPGAPSTLPQNNYGAPRPQPPHYAANQGPQSVSQAVLNQAALQRRQKLQLIQHQRRLLARQQQQQLLAVGDGAGPGPQLSPAALQHMDELLNNTVPPNMTIQRSSNLPDSQLSPSYSNVLLNSPGHTQGPPTPGQQQVSPSQDRPNINLQPFSPLLQNNQSNVNFSPGQTRLSFSGGIPTFSSSQLSPRVPQGQPGSQFPSQLSPQSGTVGGARGSPGVPGPANTGSGPSLQGQPSPGGAWSGGNMPLSTRPQANPMLSAHLANNFPGRNFTRAQLRGPTGPRPLFNEGNASPGPTPGPPNVLNNNLYLQQQQQQQMRLQRTISAPGGSVPGGMGASHSHSRHYSMGNRDYYPPFRTPPYHSSTPYNDSHLYRSPAPAPPPSYLRPMYPYSTEPCSSPLPPPPCPSPGLQPHPQPETNNHTGAMVVDSRHNHNPPSATSYVNPQNQSTAAAASERLRHPPPHVSTGNATMTSDYVRQELRAVVAGRTLQQSPGLGGPSQNQSPLSSGQGPGSGTNQHNNPAMPGGQSLSQADLEELGLSLELPQDVLTGEAPKGNSWDSPTFQNSPAQTNRNNMEERPRTDSKMSLLQKLLSE